MTSQPNCFEVVSSANLLIIITSYSKNRETQGSGYTLCSIRKRRDKEKLKGESITVRTVMRNSSLQSLQFVLF